MYDLFENVWGQHDEVSVGHMVELTHSVSFNQNRSTNLTLIDLSPPDSSVCNRKSRVREASRLERYAIGTIRT